MSETPALNNSNLHDDIRLYSTPVRVKESFSLKKGAAGFLSVAAIVACVAYTVFHFGGAPASTVLPLAFGLGGGLAGAVGYFAGRKVELQKQVTNRQWVRADHPDYDENGDPVYKGL